ADEDAVAFLEPGLLDLLPVDERPVGGPQVLDGDLPAGDGDLGVLARDHVLDQHHVQLAGPADHDLLLHLQPELSALVLPRDDLKGEGLLPRSSLCRRTHWATTSLTSLALPMGTIPQTARSTLEGCCRTRFRYMAALLFCGSLASTASQIPIA